MGSGRAPKSEDPGAGGLKTEVSNSGQTGAKGWEASDDGMHWVRQSTQLWAAQALGGIWTGRRSNPRTESHRRRRADAAVTCWRGQASGGRRTSILFW